MNNIARVLMEFIKLHKKVFVFMNLYETHISTMFTLLVTTYQGTCVETLSFLLFCVLVRFVFVFFFFNFSRCNMWYFVASKRFLPVRKMFRQENFE